MIIGIHYIDTIDWQSRARGQRISWSISTIQLETHLMDVSQSQWKYRTRYFGLLIHDARYSEEFPKYSRITGGFWWKDGHTIGFSEYVEEN